MLRRPSFGPKLAQYDLVFLESPIPIPRIDTEEQVAGAGIKSNTGPTEPRLINGLGQRDDCTLDVCSKALVKLMSSDPSLLSGMDDDLLESITLLSEPTKKGYERTLARDRNRDNTARKNVQLYAEDASFAEKKKTVTPMLTPGGISNAKRAALARANMVLLSPSSNAAAVAATATSKQDGRMTGRFTSTSVVRSTFTPLMQQEKPLPVVLLDDNMLNLVDGGTKTKTRAVGSTKKKAKRARRGRKKNSSSSSSGSSSNNSEDENYRGDRFVAKKSTSRASVDECDSCHSNNGTNDNASVASDSDEGRQTKLEKVGKQKQEPNERATDSSNDDSTDHREPESTRGDSISSVSQHQEVPVSAISAVLIQSPPSLSPSDNASDHSSSRNTMNTMSEYSFSGDSPWDTANFSYGSFSGPRQMEEELEAVLKAKQLEKEVEASQQRIRALESQIANQESQQDLLSTEQQFQLQEARATIKLLQEQLRLQEINARQAAHNRDSICLSKLRQTELYANEDDESAALKKKLKVLERQLKQAGISVAEVIPYDVAKKKVTEISKRLQEIGSSEVVLENKQAQAAARKEYYILEQEMEKYHMALVMTDEYIEEQRRREQEWEDTNRVANLKALRLLRSAIPVNISLLSERDLVELVTPSEIQFPAELARRIKRTNALQLLRTDPNTIAKMHPSVIEGYRTTGLTLLERRALHVVMQEPFHEWKKQQNNDMAQKKYAWYCKLKEAFVTAASNLQNHCKSSDTRATAGSDEEDEDETTKKHTCTLLGLACPVRAEERIRKLYCGLGFTSEAEFIEEDILKSDPDGAGEKALLEAQSHAREMVANQRQRDLKAHYKMNMREVAQAIGTMEEIDSILEHLLDLDDSFPHSGKECQQLSHCNSLLNCARDLMLLLAKRAGICVTGKRDPAKDEEDKRSSAEIVEAGRGISILLEILADISALLFNEEDKLRGNKPVTAATLKAVQELVDDVQQKNAKAMDGTAQVNAQKSGKRVPWMKRGVRDGSIDVCAQHRVSVDDNSSIPFAVESIEQGNCTSALLFDAIKARRKHISKQSEANGNGVDRKTGGPITKPGRPINLMAAIRARKRTQSNSTAENTSATTATEDVLDVCKSDAATSA
ncbi:unnamed protein product [Phytophthora fragariaefolia]|uniref:Unnamed protein product n=1 Tax=Phytophthora fragariaefolia TaxID=1490495 RepID=A0A9W6XJ69_9STRA|nr:unnamed protein product [Phytophthora fragariaefolia]